MSLFFNRLVQRDVNEIIGYYREEASETVADEFYSELMEKLSKIEANPKCSHFVSPTLRRLNLKRFPYHILYRTIGENARILVVKHNQRAPGFGTRRK